MAEICYFHVSKQRSFPYSVSTDQETKWSFAVDCGSEYRKRGKHYRALVNIRNDTALRPPMFSANNNASFAFSHGTAEQC